MRLNRNMILFVIFIALGAYVYFFETGLKQEPAPVEKVEKIRQVEADLVEELSLQVDDNYMLFKKNGGQWRIVSPIEADAIHNRVAYLVSVFDYPIIREISANPTDLSLYGLNNPRIELGIRLKGEDAFTILQVGDSTPQGLSCYAKFKDKPRVFLVGHLYQLELNKDVASFTK